MNLKEIRKERKKTQTQIANYLGITQQAYAMYESGSRNPPTDILQKLSDYYNVSVDYLLGRNTDNQIYLQFNNISPLTKKRVPMLGKIACGEPIFCDEDRESYIMTGTDINADFCLTAQGDSMIGARILDGDIVFIRRQEMVENGEIAAVVIDNEATLKRVYYSPGRLVLQAENPKYPPLVYTKEELNNIIILGKAIAFQSDVK